MKIETMKVKDLIPYEKNAKKHNRTQILNVAESIRRFGFAQPLVVDKDNVLIIGHCRLLAAKHLQIREVPVVKMENLTEEEVKELRLLDNKLNESEWDMELLADELKGLDLEGFEIDWELPEEEPEPEVIEVDPPEDPEPVCYGNKIDNMVLRNARRKNDYIQNDNMKDEEFRKFLKAAFQSCDAVMKKGAVFYIWHADTEGYNFRGACRDVGWKVRECIIWVKNSLTLGHADYQWRHEPCLYGWKDGASHYFIDRRDINTVIEDELDFDKMKKEDMKKLLELIFEETPTTILRAAKPLHSDLHPTMKPITLMAKQVNNSTKGGGLVLDIFGGSGSTLMACEQLNRRCFTCELDPHYADVIIARWEEFTGRKAEKING